MSSLEENKSHKGNQGPMSILIDTMAQIENINCNISILSAQKNRSDKRLESISLDVEVLRKNLKACIDLLSSSNQTLDYSINAQIAQEPNNNDKGTNSGPMTVIPSADEVQKVAPIVRAEKPKMEPMRHKRPKVLIFDDIKSEPTLKRKIPEHQEGSLFGHIENVNLSQGPMAFNVSGVADAQYTYTNVIQPKAGLFKVQPSAPNLGPFLLGSCKLPLGKRVIRSLDNMGMLVR